MAHLKQIAIALPLMMLLVFGSGGVGVLTCACSGKMKVLMPTDNQCCKGEADCMTLTVDEVSDADFTPSPSVVPQPIMALLHHGATNATLFSTHSAPNIHSSLALPPPGLACRSMVMRV